MTLARENDDDTDDRDHREVTLYDDDALELMTHWWGSQSDPLYAIHSMGGQHEAWVFQDAIDNLDSTISRVKKVGRNKYQLGQGTFSKAEIDELHKIRDELSMALYEDTGEMHEAQRVADFNTLPELIRHSHAEGATHTSGNGEHTRIYFPRGDGQYEEATVWKKENYWHAQGPGSRKVVRRPPRGATPITPQTSRRAAEASADSPTTKPGAHGTLYLYEIKYTDPSDEGMGELSMRRWAYNLEHAEERFYSGEDAEGWKIVSIARVPESGGMHRATRHRPTRESRTVQDYNVIDSRGRKLAGPFKSQSEANGEASRLGGHVEFKPARRGLPPGAPKPPSSYPMFRESVREVNFQDGERLRIRVIGPQGQLADPPFWYTVVGRMTLEEVALQFAQTIQPGMFVSIKTGSMSWTFRKELHGGQNAVKRVLKLPTARYR